MSQKKNMAAVLYAANDLRYEEVPLPTPKDNEVLIAVKKVGICGSDDHYYRHGRIWDFIVKEPMILGHETSGEVVSVGKNVTHLAAGDIVAIEPGVSCSDCSFCKEGLYNLCTAMVFCATPPVNGTLCNYYVHDSKFVFKIPHKEPGFKDNTFEKAALLEPASVAVHACSKADIQIGHNVLVLGSGSIGVLNMLAAKAYGANRVVMTDVVQEQLDFAKEAGADFIFNVGKIPGGPEKVAEHIKNETGLSFDSVIECSGFESSIQTGLYAAKPNANVVLVGMADKTPKLPVSEISVKELSVKGLFRYRHTYPKAIELVANGKLNLDCMIPDNNGRFKLSEVHKAFEAGFPKPGVKLTSRKPIKIMVDCSLEH
eukprot:TRINITY_DN2233_c0_g1_i1.p1 TRINITY_DN2233_c0_g1~~TRINITY_DN2233_c0_g1_i1.p1  ORF type:complete len:371 (-),score=58.43 TRINITY_DN2233_c0_g1_i1:92-1204(-)